MNSDFYALKDTVMSVPRVGHCMHIEDAEDKIARAVKPAV